ncbi:MAG: TIGR03943 family putative permease subunit [Candidatus Tyrphobacter sp.]
MNSVIVTLCVLCALALLPAPTIRGVLATAAASLFEGTPFILAGIALRALVVRHARADGRTASAAVALLGCGCAGGASARSLPAAVATAMVFGLPVALLRLCGGMLAAVSLRSLRERLPCRHCPEDAIDDGNASLAAQLAAMLPAALLGATALHAFANVRFDLAPPLLQWLFGATLGALASPCALGAVAMSASLHAREPLAAIGVLCTSGILDLRAVLPAHDRTSGHDGLAYALCALALALVAARGGDALVHPRFVLALGLCAVACGFLALRHRGASSSRARLASLLMLAGAVVTAPPPIYTATETTLADLFVGERVTFTGELVHGKDADALVRFAITCCRADAAPVAIRLAARLVGRNGEWVRAQGDVRRAGSSLALDASQIRRVAPPSDPFIYR